MVSFDKCFKKGLEEKIINFDELVAQALEKRNHISIKKYKDVLYVADPFTGFIGDCEFCKYYDDISNVTTGGYCLLHHVACGYGFTCLDNTSEYKMEV